MKHQLSGVTAILALASSPVKALYSPEMAGEVPNAHVKAQLP